MEPKDIYSRDILQRYTDFAGKPVFPTKTAMDELSDIDCDLWEAIEILNSGFVMRKRQEGVIEKAQRKGHKIINIVVVDMGSYFKLIHAGKFSMARKFKK